MIDLTGKIGINPTYSVSIDGSDVTGDVARRLIFLRVLDARQFENSRFELQMDNRAPYLALPTIGSTVTINMGYDGNNRNMGTYEVDECVVYGIPHTVTIIGKAKGNSSDFKGTQQRSWHNQTLQDIVSSIATDSGLVPNISGDIGSIKIDHVDQTQSNMDFLTYLARNYNATFKVMNGTLYFASSNQQQGDSLTIDITEQTHFQYTYQTRGYFPGGVVARYADKASGTEKIASTGNPQPGNYRAMQEVFPDQQTAQGAAQSLDASMAGSADTLNVTLPGDPLLVSDMTLTFTGLPPQVAVEWLSDRVEHEIKGSGAYQTIVDCVSPATSSSSTGAPGAGNSSGGSSAGGGSDTEPGNNKEGGDDGHTVTEEVDGNGNIST